MLHYVTTTTQAWYNTILFSCDLPQSSGDVAPVTDVVVPGGHWVQTSDMLPSYVPRGQGSQGKAPSDVARYPATHPETGRNWRKEKIN